MAYTERAIARRRCTGTTKAGAPCRAWAVWGDPRQLCAQHAGRGHRGPIDPWRRRRLTYRQEMQANKTKYPPCTCVAYSWPHRPGGGLCRWPDPPQYRLTRPPGLHAWPRVRRPKGW